MDTLPSMGNSASPQIGQINRDPTDDYNPNKDELIIVGKVESFIDGKPTENNQANDDLERGEPR